MTPADIETRIRRLYNVTTSQYSQAEYLSDLNELKNNFLNRLINAVEEDWNWDSWTADTVALQSEYEIPEMASWTVWAKQIKEVSINYDWETYTDTWELQYIPAKLVNPHTLTAHWSWYKENQDSNQPLYYVADKQLFVAPVPRADEAGTWRIELRWIKNIADYTMATTEAEMILPYDVQNTLVQGLEPYVMRSKWMERWEVNWAIAEYERVLRNKIKEMTERVETAWEMSYPDNSPDVFFKN